MDNENREKLFKHLSNEKVSEMQKEADGKWFENCRFVGWWKNGDSYVFRNADNNTFFCMTRRFLKDIINEC